MSEREELSKAVAALESQRAVLGDAVVDTAVAPLIAKLAELDTSAPGEQRKLVTILFADLVGSTAMAERMDVEDVREVLNAFFDRWEAHIARHGGVVQKYIGDAVMAVFGLAAAHEDDAARAIRAALGMQRSLEELNGSLADAGEPRLAMRVGVHTGQVLVGNLGSRRDHELLVVGDPVNLASRLQTTAPTDGLVISHDTFRLAGDSFDVEERDPIPLKGIREPVRTYLVLGERRPAFEMSRQGGTEAPMLGRDAELRRLQDALAVTIEAGSAHLVTVTGEAGIGKSRLIHEYDRWLDEIPEAVYFFKGRASPATANLPHSLMRDAIASRMDIHDNDPPLIVRDKLERGVGAALDDRDGAVRRAHYIGRLVGLGFGDSAHLPDLLGDARAFRDQAQVYLTDYLTGLARRHPVVMLLEDLHWADDSSLDLVEDVLGDLVARPMLVVCTARPALYERRPGWGTAAATPVRLDLHHLTRDDSRRLVRELLRNGDVPPEVEDLVVSRAEDNPFYIEELVKMLIETGAVAGVDGRWRLDTTGPAQTSIPPTLVGVLQARLDGLGPEERSCLQRASVIGRTFWDDAVVHLAANEAPSPPGSDEDVLRALGEREMVFPQEASAFAGIREYLFKHALLRDVTYESVLKAHRRRYHTRAAAWLESVTARTGRAAEYAALIAEHHDRGGDGAAAAVWYRRAGEEAGRTYANAEAIRLFTHALRLVPGDDAATRYALLAGREASASLAGDRPVQAPDLDELESLAGMLDGDTTTRHRVEAALRRAAYAEVTGDYPGAIDASTRARDLARRDGDLDGEVRALLRWAGSLWRAGDLDESQPLLEEAIRLAAGAGFAELRAQALRNLGIVAEYRADYEAAKRHYLEFMDYAAGVEDRELLAKGLNDVGVIEYILGDHVAARRLLERALAIRREQGNRHGETTVLYNLAAATLAMGENDAARAYFLDVEARARAIHDREGIATALDGLGSVAFRLADYPGSLEYFRRAGEEFHAIGDQIGEGGALCNQSLSLHHQGDHEAARAAALEAADLAARVGARSEEGHARDALGRALLGLGDPAVAAGEFRAAVEIRSETEQDRLRLLSLGGLAEATAALGDLDEARALIDVILRWLEDEGIPIGTPLDGTGEPFLVYLSCALVLDAVGDARLGEVVAATLAHLEARADALADPHERNAYLEHDYVRRHLTGFGGP